MRELAERYKIIAADASKCIDKESAPPFALREDAWSLYRQSVLCAKLFGRNMSGRDQNIWEAASLGAGYLVVFLETKSASPNHARIVQAYAMLAGALAFLAHTAEHDETPFDRGLIDEIPTLTDLALTSARRSSLTGIFGAAVEAVTALQYSTGQIHGSFSDDDDFADKVMLDIESEMKLRLIFPSVRRVNKYKQEMDVKNARRALGRHREAAYLSAVNSSCVSSAAAMASGRDLIYIGAGVAGSGTALRYSAENGLVDQLELPLLSYAKVDAIRAEVLDILADERTPQSVLDDRLRDVLIDVGKAVSEPVLRQWPGRRIAFIPLNKVIDLPLATSYVNNLPAVLHADITTVPNARCMLLASLRPPRVTRQPIFVACDPGEGDDYIGNVVVEAVRVAQMYGVEPHIFGEPSKTVAPTSRLRLRTNNANRSNFEGDADWAYLPELCEAATVHLACHGYIEDEPFYESALELGGELSMNHLLKHGVAQNSIFILSACYVGGVVPSYPSELLGFPASLLSAGAGNVIASLWPVPDDATTLRFIEYLHSFLQCGYSPAVAFGRAIQNSIDAKAGPFTWGGFSVFGI